MKRLVVMGLLALGCGVSVPQAPAACAHLQRCAELEAVAFDRPSCDSQAELIQRGCFNGDEVLACFAGAACEATKDPRGLSHACGQVCSPTGDPPLAWP